MSLLQASTSDGGSGTARTSSSGRVIAMAGLRVDFRVVEEGRMLFDYLIKGGPMSVLVSVSRAGGLRTGDRAFSNSLGLDEMIEGGGRLRNDEPLGRE